MNDQIDLRSAISHLRTILRDPEKIRIVLYRCLARAERQAPPGVRGSFIPVASAFEAYAALDKVLSAARQDVLIVDGYMDRKVLTDYARSVPQGASVRLLTDSAKRHASLIPAGTNWVKEFGASRPIELRLTSPGMLHDRLIIIDDSVTWLLSQSLNAFAKRSPATITQAPNEINSEKIPAYRLMWDGAQPQAL